MPSPTSASALSSIPSTPSKQDHKIQTKRPSRSSFNTASNKTPKASLKDNNELNEQKQSLKDAIDEQESSLNSESGKESVIDTATITTQRKTGNNQTMLNPRNDLTSNRTYGSDEDNLAGLINERNKLTKFLYDFEYFLDKGNQAELCPNGKWNISTNSVSTGTQRPDNTDLIDEIVSTVAPRTVAQAQLNILIEVLEKLKLEGALTHLNLSEEDLELIKQEMKNLLSLRYKDEPEREYLLPARTLYAGGSSFKASSWLNLGKKDPNLHYVNDETFPSVSPRRASKFGPATIAKFWKKAKKYKNNH